MCLSNFLSFFRIKKIIKLLGAYLKKNNLFNCMLFRDAGENLLGHPVEQPEKWKPLPNIFSGTFICSREERDKTTSIIGTYYLMSSSILQHIGLAIHSICSSLLLIEEGLVLQHWADQQRPPRSPKDDWRPTWTCFCSSSCSFCHLRLHLLRRERSLQVHWDL